MKAVISRDGSIRLPIAVRTRLALDPGTTVRLDVDRDLLVIRRATPRLRATRHELPVQPDPATALRREAAGESFAAVSYERRLHE